MMATCVSCLSGADRQVRLVGKPEWLCAACLPPEGYRTETALDGARQATARIGKPSPCGAPRRQTLSEQVAEFHRAMGQPVLESPRAPGDERVRLRLRLVAEEFFELLAASIAAEPTLEAAHSLVRQAIDSDTVRVDLVEVADALADLDYVVEGTRLEFGIDGGPIAAEVHRSNMSKLGPDGNPALNERGKVTKGPNFSPPDIAGDLRRQGWQP